MNELSQFLIESILGEAEGVDNKVVVYAGRFQPFHKGHYATYSHLVKKFGKNNVYIGTSNKTDNNKSPFNFKEKVMIITKMFGIPKNKIVQVKNPYVPTEVLTKFDKDTTAFITVVGKKDAGRLGSRGKFFTPYKDNLDFEGYEDKGYVYVAPEGAGGVSGTEVRKGLSSGSEEDKKNFFTKRAYPKFDKKIFDFITNTLNEDFTISKEVLENWLISYGNDLIKEASATMGKTAVDDGPNYIFPNYNTFDRVSKKRAEAVGYTVLSQIMSDELTDIDPHPIYPEGPVKAVTPYPAGVAGKTTATNQKDFYGTDAYNKWFRHVTRIAGLVGYSIINFDELKDDKKQSTKDLSNEKKPQGNVVSEDIKLPVKIGDTILTGRFKNKKTIIKTIGKDEHGMPTINGRKVVNFRIVKEGTVNEIPMADLVKIDKYADKQLNPVDIVLTDKHFFDRLTDPRNKKEISQAELIGFFKRLGKKKKDFVNFLDLYGQIVAKDSRSKINIPFMKQANKVIAKTIMRKDDFKTSDPEYKFESLPTKVTDKFKAVKSGKPSSEAEKDFNDHHTYSSYAKRGSMAEPDTIDFDDDGKSPGHQANDKNTKKKGYEPVTEKINSFYYDDLKSYVYKRRGEISKVFKNLSDKQKGEYLEKLYIKLFQGPTSRMVHKDIKGKGGELLKMLIKDKRVKEGLGHGYPDQKWMDKHEKEIKKLRKKFDKEKLQYNEPYALGGGITESLILEGGAYGHMNHPFDTEINLTFGQLKDIVQKALEGNLELTREKTDGQALAVSWRDGRLVAARNKGHLKNKGEGALDINGVAVKFAGRGELEKAYNFAMKDLTKAISKLSEKQRDKIFKGGACFMNLEVIYPTSVNVIPYGQALLVFHGTMEYNEDGVAIGENQDAARILAGMIKQVNQQVQSAYTIQGPPVVQLPKSKNLSSTKGKYNSQISKLQKKFKLKDNDGIADYHQAFWMDFVNKKSPSKLDNKTLMGLVKRWAFYDKSFRLDKKNLSDEKTLEWAKGIDKNDHAKMAKDNIRPFENIFLGLGAEVLSFMSSALTVNPDKAVRDMKKRLDKTIKDVQKLGDVKKVKKLKLELERLTSIGGKNKIVPNEGIVFVYGGKTFKLTGTFAPLNQILGLFYE
jgi:hypothetical protein